MFRRSVIAAVVALTLLITMTAGVAASHRPVWAFAVPLSGAQEVSGGDQDARAFGIVVIRPAAGRVCYLLGWRKIDGDVWGGHIHNAPAGANGGIVVSLFGGPQGPNTAFPGARYLVHDCVSADSDVLWDIVEDPELYYLNLHSTVHNGGAVRGQLD